MKSILSLLLFVSLLLVGQGQNLSGADFDESSDDYITGLTFTVNGVSFKMVKVEGGTFTMGATAEMEGEAWDDEKPTHSVTLSNYFIGETEVTQALWEAVMGSNPSCHKGGNLPVEQVSWDDCQEFIRKLNRLTGKRFRLPTEAEWEYAARGGNKSQGYRYAGNNTISEVAWYGYNSGNQTHPVATRKANELGLYDMSGNVWEWCQDWFGSYSSSPQTNSKGPDIGNDRALRSGGWDSDARVCRSSFRGNGTPSHRFSVIGLRLALSDIDKTATSQSYPKRPQVGVQVGEEDSVRDDSEVFVFVEEPPSFPGGEEAMYRYLSENIRYPEEARNAHVSGKVFVNFVIEKDGRITNVKVLRDIGCGCGAEARRVVENMPRWKPGRQRGQAVRCEFNLPIDFTLH